MRGYPLRIDEGVFVMARKSKEQTRNALVEDALYQLAVDGNLKAIQFWLEHRLPVRWGEISAERNTNRGLDVVKLADLINNPVDAENNCACHK